MIKVDQTLFGVGKGNCVPACVSTIIGVPLLSIPNFCAIYAPDEWYPEFIRWLRPLGLAPWTLTLEGDLPDWIGRDMPDIPWIAMGETARGLHACVYIGDTLFHDPNPCRDGLQSIVDGTFFLTRHLRSTAWR